MMSLAQRLLLIAIAEWVLVIVRRNMTESDVLKMQHTEALLNAVKTGE